MQLTERNGNEVVASFPIPDKDQLMLVTDKGKLIRCPVNDIRIAGRQTQGVTLFNVSDGERVVSVAKLEEMNDHLTITGIYPGTFDPVTFGHLDIIERACNIVDKLIISVAENIHKKPYFTVNERVLMIQESLKLIDTNKCLIEVVGFDNLLVDHAKKFNAKVIIRGLRAVADFEYEFQMAGMNSKLAPDV